MQQQSEQQHTLDEGVLRNWIGKTESRGDRIDTRRANFLKATLVPDRPDLCDGDRLPAGWHWIYFLDAPRMDRLGRDGHAEPGDFLPPVALPRRMWAGSRLKFHRPIELGEQVSKVSQVAAVSRKTGRSGELCFVTVSHKYFSNDELRLEEDHDIVYREAQSARERSDPPPAPAQSDRSIVITPSTTLLFRYSALTFNGHRIHYDIDFCRDVEGYPGLVVHAPLTATLMLGLAEQYCEGTNRRIDEFRQRSVSPLFHDNPMTLHLQQNALGCELWAASHEGRLAATGSVGLTGS